MIFWYDAANAAAIVGHADPLTLDAATGAFVTAAGEAVATPISLWAFGAMPLNNGNVGTIYYTAAYYELEGIVNPTNPEYVPYTAEEIAAIVGHADPLTLEAENGNFVTADGTAVASPIK